MLEVKLILTNSSSIVLIHSLIYLALKAIVMSFPSSEIVMFSVTLPMSDALDKVQSLSRTSNLTRLFLSILARRLALSRPYSSCFLLIVTVVLVEEGITCL